VRVDAHPADPGPVDGWYRTASVLHSNGDAMDIAVRDGRIVGVRGRADDRVNHGRLGPKDLYGWQANNSTDRLRRPLVRDGDRLVETDWDTAMDRIVARSRELLHGPGGWGRFGFYTSGQLFLEEYYTLAVIGKARNEDLLAVVTACESETATQLKWLTTRIKQAAPQTLVVA
jgi:anaerobic selenocysteine-containing dehydrogenase